MFTGEPFEKFETVFEQIPSIGDSEWPLDFSVNNDSFSA